MSFPINVNIPNENNDPADDVQPINTNFVNINGFLTVDHVAPGSIGDGFHEQVTYFTENIPTLLPTEPTSIAFTANAQTAIGIMTGLSKSPASGIAQNFLANQNAIFPLSSIRAFVAFTLTLAPGAQTILNSFNITSVTVDATRKIFTILLVTGTTVGVNLVP